MKSDMKNIETFFKIDDAKMKKKKNFLNNQSFVNWTKFHKKGNYVALSYTYVDHQKKLLSGVLLLMKEIASFFQPGEHIVCSY